MIEVQSDETNELFNGLMLFRSQLQQPTKDATNPFFKQGYVTLEGVMRSVDAGLKGTGISYLQVVDNDENGNVGVKTILTHKSGQYFETGVLSLTPEKKNPQGYGSAITYAKRYQLSALFGVSSDKDDDGNKATPSNKSSYQRQEPRQQAKPKQNDKAQEFQNLVNQAAKKLKAEPKEIIQSVKNVADQDEGYKKGNKDQQQTKLINILKDMLDPKE